VHLSAFSLSHIILDRCDDLLRHAVDVRAFGVRIVKRRGFCSDEEAET
jgi:hypothetical protein